MSAPPKPPRLSTVKLPTSNDPNVLLIKEVTTLAERLRAAAMESSKLTKLKGSSELITRIVEVLTEIDQQSSKVLLAMRTSPTVENDLNLLREALLKVEDFFGSVNKAHWFTSKYKLRVAMQNNHQTLRARCTQLLAGVSLALLSKSSDIYTSALNYFYGINGSPLNYSFAFERFLRAADEHESNAMVMVAKCYLNGWGVDLDEHIGAEVRVVVTVCLFACFSVCCNLTRGLVTNSG
jgi:hypothetical protein